VLAPGHLAPGQRPQLARTMPAIDSSLRYKYVFANLFANSPNVVGRRTHFLTGTESGITHCLPNLLEKTKRGVGWAHRSRTNSKNAIVITVTNSSSDKMFHFSSALTDA
jgi:hypothetical protein